MGEKGLGYYDLARKLETCRVWRSWLGDSSYASFVHSLDSPSKWEAFMRVDDSKSRAQIHLQLRVRALLFDKASVSLFLRSNPSSSSSSSLASSSVAVSKLNPTYLRLHGDDVYFTLENSVQDGVQHRDGGVSSTSASSKIQSRAAFSGRSRYGEPEIDNVPQRVRNGELPETWYNQFIEKYRIGKRYSLSSADHELDKRTPEEMSAYLRLLERHKKRRMAFKEDHSMGYGNSMLENQSNLHPNSVLNGSSLIEDDAPLFPETMFTLNCVPESALPHTDRVEENQKVEFYGVLDSLPQIMTRNPHIRPQYLSIEHGGSLSRGKIGSEGNRKHLGPEQASLMSQKVIARMLASVGFGGASEVPVEVFSQLLSCHVCKLGRILKVLADSYRKQCSATELLKMFLKTLGYSNLGPLAEHVKDGSRNFVQPTQQQLQGIQPQLQSQHHSSLLLPQQMPRQMHPQMQQIIHPQNPAFQQQQQHLERMRRRQPSTRTVMDMGKDRPMVQVKIENPTELPMDGNALNSINARHPQMQFPPQQIASMSNLHAPGSQFRQISSIQMPQIQTQNMGIVRARPVKVEGFQELMGGEATSKHDTEENRLMSPSSK
ncbi:hypothetical protein CIPAW_08G141000 [Carya illinoinensis]|uniref:Bromodomain associated domain-containing protein n=2 Tax=Carya illinoinensis TaxID=32201 RepID=A0A8T1PV55_CARIL|nr:hypothetical protein CIPAW_08G141000 [Carya illinoinensis]